MQDPATLAWLIQCDIPLPGEVPPGGYPAPATIQRVIDALPGIRANYVIGRTVWEVAVISRKDVIWAILAVRDYSGDPEEPQPFYFSAGWDEMILALTSSMAKYCGPLVLLHESGLPPQVVM